MMREKLFLSLNRLVCEFCQLTKAVFCLLCVLFSFDVHSQTIQDIADKPIESAILDLKPILKNHIKNEIAIVGLGDVAVLARESQKLNTAICAYLIQEKGFQHVLLIAEEWLMRPLNDYLTSTTVPDDAVLDSLMHFSLSEQQFCTVEFKSFLIWLKQYNLAHPNHVVRLVGVASSVLIPSSYFLAKYIFPLDRNMGIQLTKKWEIDFYDEATALDDIKKWYHSLERLDFSDEHKKLLNQCRSDLEHNQFVRAIPVSNEGFSKEQANQINDYISNKVLASNKAILYANVSQVVRTTLQSNAIQGNPFIHSVGKKLHAHLQGNYYVCITDFSDSADVFRMNPATYEGLVDHFTASEDRKKMLSTKDRFFAVKDKSRLHQFVPDVISLVKGRETIISPNRETSLFDALFVFKTLTVSTFLK